MRRGSSGLNLLLGVNKPAGMSSHDVVNAVRRALGERRVGHAGTLDPAAEGVLVVGVGQGTRLMGLLTAECKSYLASVRFGWETTTDDAEGEVTHTASVPDELRDPAKAQALLDTFLGEQNQVPPAYSAISVDGKRSYARARAGENVVLEPRRVNIMVAQLLSITDKGEGSDASQQVAQTMSDTVGAGLEWQCAFTVSKGTYVRSIARDLGRRAGSAAHLAMLCRSSSGTVTLAQCTSLERIAELGAQEIETVALDPARALGLPVRKVLDAEKADVSCGRPIEADGRRRGERVALVRDGRLWGVWESNGLCLVAKVNFPHGVAGVRES